MPYDGTDVHSGAVVVAEETSKSQITKHKQIPITKSQTTGKRLPDVPPTLWSLVIEICL